jgi:hypothetical protein
VYGFALFFLIEVRAGTGARTYVYALLQYLSDSLTIVNFPPGCQAGPKTKNVVGVGHSPEVLKYRIIYGGYPEATIGYPRSRHTIYSLRSYLMSRTLVNRNLSRIVSYRAIAAKYLRSHPPTVTHLIPPMIVQARLLWKKERTTQDKKREDLVVVESGSG